MATKKTKTNKQKAKAAESKSLTDMQEKFCHYFLATGGNGKKAALLAGYSASTDEALTEMGRKNLKKPAIIARIQELADDVDAAKPEEILRFWTRVIRGHPMQQQVRGELVVAPFDARTQTAASQFLAKARQMFVDKVEVEQSGGLYVLLPDNQRDGTFKLPRRVSSEEELLHQDESESEEEEDG